MTISDDLFVLVKSLSKNEQIYFRKFAQLHVLGQENNYVQLFEALEAQEKYDEPALVKMFAQGKSASQFSVLKNYLFNLILKALRNFHAELSVRAELRAQLQNVSLLFEKGLHAQAQKLLRRCRKTAELCELFRELIEISGLEQTLLLFGKSYDADTIRSMNAMLDERKLVLQKMQNAYDYDRIEYNLSHLLQKGAGTKKEVAQLMKHPLMKSERQALCVVSQLKFHHIHSTYCYYTAQRKACIVHLQKEVDLLQQHPDILQLRLQDYVLLSNNLLLLLLELNDYKKFDARLLLFRQQLATLKISTRLWEQAVAHNYITEMTRWYGDFNYAKLLAVAAELQRQQKMQKAVLNLYDSFQFTDLLMRAAFRAGKFDEALTHAVALLNHADAPAKFRDYNHARLLNLLIHFELGHFDLLDYQLQSFQRQVMKTEKDNALFAAIVSFLKKFPSAVDRKKRQALLQKLVADVAAAKTASGYFDFDAWARGKVGV